MRTKSISLLPHILHFNVVNFNPCLNKYEIISSYQVFKNLVLQYSTKWKHISHVSRSFFSSVLASAAACRKTRRRVSAHRSLPPENKQSRPGGKKRSCHNPLMKRLICLFSLSTRLKCHIRPNTGFPLARLINFATVTLAAANESDSEKLQSWRLLITQEANNGWHRARSEAEEKKGTPSTSNRVISLCGKKGNVSRGKTEKAGNLIFNVGLLAAARRALFPLFALALSGCLLWLALSPPLKSPWVTLHLMMNSGPGQAGEDYSPESPGSPTPWFMTYLSVRHIGGAVRERKQETKGGWWAELCSYNCQSRLRLSAERGPVFITEVLRAIKWFRGEAS